MEKILMAEALDLRDFLKKKIQDQIKKATFVVVVQEQTKNYQGKPVETYETSIQEEYQSIKDQIDRYNRLCRAITLSNATTTITFKDGTTMTIAEAIQLKKNKRVGVFSKEALSLTDLLLNEMQDQAKDAISAEDNYNRNLERMRNQYIDTKIANSGNTKEPVTPEFLAAVDQFIKPFGVKVINPISIKDQVEELKAQRDKFDSEVETLLKVSNATTVIEF